jgi:urease accessory protein
MLQVTERLTEPAEPRAILTLPYELRQKSRLRTQLDNGAPVALLLAPGNPLRHGDLLRATDGLIIEVRAAPESVSTAFSRDTLLLARACYHLGNRHVPLQIGDTWVRYAHDHVLDTLVAGLGLRVFAETTPFEPEGGAYAHEDRPLLRVHHGHGH